MLGKRLIASFAMITPMLVLLWLDTQHNGGLPGIWSVPVVLLASVVIAGELITMTSQDTPGAISWVAYAGAFLCQIAVISPELSQYLPLIPISNRWLAVSAILALTLGASFGNELLQFESNRPSTQKIALTMFVVLYSGWLLGFLTATRIELENYKGVVALFSILFIIKMSDAGAYFAGKNLGKHKLAPVLSPGKTIEGLFGGILAAVFAGWFVFAVVQKQLLPDATVNWLWVCAYSLSICFVGVAGDLSESLIKRDMGCKDSSGWLPGLGGIMDTADSVLLAAPVAYFWWASGLL